MLTTSLALAAAPRQPTGDGRLSAEPLSIYDYPNLVETTQPALPTLPST